MAKSNRSIFFFLIIMVLLAAFIGWLMLFQPEPVVTETVEEIPHERVFKP